MTRLLPFVLLVCAGCHRKSTETAFEAPAAPLTPMLTVSERPSSLQSEQIDLDGDGKANLWNFRDASGVIVRKETDLNLDGRVDVVSHFSGDALVGEEMDGDFDGRIDWVDHYTGGVRDRAEADTDFDGRIDVIFYYEAGTLVRKERLTLP
jgi:hypothetical protein